MLPHIVWRHYINLKLRLQNPLVLLATDDVSEAKCLDARDEPWLIHTLIKNEKLLSVARVRPRTCYGITELLLP